MHGKLFLAIDLPHGTENGRVRRIISRRVERLIQRETRLLAWLIFSHLAVRTRQFEVLKLCSQADRGPHPRIVAPLCLTP